jgi:hypothetical protein
VRHVHELAADRREQALLSRLLAGVIERHEALQSDQQTDDLLLAHLAPAPDPVVRNAPER